MMPSTRGWPLFAIVTLLAAAIDLATKQLAFTRLGMPGIGPRMVLVPGILVFETNLNEGALFGMGQGLGLVFAGISFAALAGILAMLIRPAARSSSWLVIALALVAGGIIGNLYDRLGLPGLRWHAPAERLGEPVLAVRDWIHVMVPGVIDWPIFNLADSWLVIGAAMLLLLSLWSPAATSDPAGGADTDPRPE